MKNQAYCNQCLHLVAATRQARDGKIYLVKDCPDCGQTETLISSDACRSDVKSSLDDGFNHQNCQMTCLTCRHPVQPNLVFIDVTNRCNMNCPVCINNTPSMGFLFEPPLEYFERIFNHLATLTPKPSVQLFGGEPTVRKDLFTIIKMAQKHGLPVRIVTNGLKLADEDYCRQIIKSRATILFSYDGDNPEAYSVMRGSDKYLSRKLKALENIAKIGGAKVTLMTLVSKGFNDRELPQLFQFCHERQKNIRAVYFIPLAHTWEPETLALDPPRTTIEDIEQFVDDAFPGEKVEFLPAGFITQIQPLLTALRVKPLPFAGAHPNCESIYILVSDGEKFVPISHYLKGSMIDLADDMRRVAARFKGKVGAPGSKGGKLLHLRGLLAMSGILLRQANFGRLFKGSGLGKIYHALATPLSFLMGHRSRDVIGRHINFQGTLQLFNLPFEDMDNLETERMERCPSAFMFYDPETDAVKNVPVCAWGMHKTTAMRKIADHYHTANAEEAPAAV